MALCHAVLISVRYIDKSRVPQCRSQVRAGGLCAGGGDGKRGAGVDVAHCLRVPAPVLFGVLDDAQGVYPEVLEPELSRHLDGVSEGTIERRDRDGLSARLDNF